MNGKEMHLTHESGLEVLQFIFPFFFNQKSTCILKAGLKKFKIKNNNNNKHWTHKCKIYITILRTQKWKQKHWSVIFTYSNSQVCFMFELR